MDTVVLGCTHYPFVMTSIQRALGARVELIDTAAAVARQTAVQVESLRRLAALHPSGGSDAPGMGAPTAAVTAYTSGDVGALHRVCSAWLDFSVQPRALP